MTTSFAVSWDYRCPFARIGHQHVLAGLRDGADWEVHFLPFSLGQMHVEEGRPDVWDDPTKETGLLALQAGTVVRDQFPDHFDGVHQGVALKVPPYEYAHPQDILEQVIDQGRTPLFVALDGITDPRNLGAIIRSTGAFGGNGVILPQRRSASVNSAAWKTSAGAAARIPVGFLPSVRRHRGPPLPAPNGFRTLRPGSPPRGRRRHPLT